MEGFNVRNLFTCTSELDWFSSNVTNRQSSTTTSIAINLGKDDPSHFQLSIKLTRNIGCFLTNHSINDKQDFIWLSQCFHITKLIHEELINLQTTRSINQDIVVMISLGLLQTLTYNLNSWYFCSKCKDRHINLLSQGLKLVNGSWTINIRRNHQRTGIFFLLEFVSQLTCKSCFTSSLQTNHHDDCRNLR
ncbi:Uncharacterised protein [Streptococcus pneumoniae]|nr:Uncharacterised protein [Streptococcus pneumoniae]